MTESDVLESLRVQILEAQPGDVVCLVAEHGTLTAETADRIKRHFADLVPAGVKVAVMGGIHVDKVIRP